MDDRKIRCQTKKNICFVNENFFAEWSPEMAYVLGFFAADGCISKNATRQNYYLDFTSTDLDVLEKIKSAMQAEQKISKRERNERWKPSYRLQIGSRKIFYDLYKLGFTTRKSKTIQLPKIPNNYFADFLRGYFDGDGCISYGEYKRKNRPSMQKVVIMSFTSGSNIFLIQLKARIAEICKTKGGFIHKKQNRGYELVYSSVDTKKILRYIYQCKNCIRMHRKYEKSMRLFEMWGGSSTG